MKVACPLIVFDTETMDKIYSNFYIRVIYISPINLVCVHEITGLGAVPLSLDEVSDHFVPTDF